MERASIAPHPRMRQKREAVLGVSRIPSQLTWSCAPLRIEIYAYRLTWSSTSPKANDENFDASRGITHPGFLTFIQALSLVGCGLVGDAASDVTPHRPLEQVCLWL
jgi:hypothetical protein